MSLPTGAGSQSVVQLLLLVGFFMFIIYFSYTEIKAIQLLKLDYFKVNDDLFRNLIRN